jgi:hypothetical protein
LLLFQDWVSRGEADLSEESRSLGEDFGSGEVVLVERASTSGDVMTASYESSSNFESLSSMVAEEDEVE